MKGNTGTRTASRLSKKIFVVGKVYDTALMTDDRIRDIVQKDLDDYIGAGKVDFSIHTGPDMISLVFTRFTDYYGQRNADLTGEMTDADAFMITGEGYNGFHLPFMFPTAPFGYTPYLMDQSDFKRSYQESAILLGADKVKRMEMEVTSHSVVIRIK